MNKKALVWSTIGKLLLAVAIILLITLITFLMKDKLLSLLDQFKLLMRAR